MLKPHIDINTLEPGQIGSALIRAIRDEDLDTINKIDMFKIPLDGLNNLTEALYHAIKKGPLYVKPILNSHVDVNHSHPFTGSPLLLAINVGDLDVIKLLVEKGADANDPSDDKGDFSPLTAAAMPNKNHILAYFIEKGFDVNACVFPLKENALMVAVSSESLNALQMLLDAGANPKIKSSNGMTPSDCAVLNSYHKAEAILDTHALKRKALKEKERLIEAAVTSLDGNDDSHLVTGKRVRL